jgi:hypothetical protein
VEHRSTRQRQPLWFSSMRPDTFAGVVVSLAQVVTIAERLLDGDAEGHVRRSIEEFAAVFERREAIEPAVARMRNSIVMLHESRRSGARRAFEHDKVLIEDLDKAIEERLVPELRRLGFDVHF